MNKLEKAVIRALKSYGYSVEVRRDTGSNLAWIDPKKKEFVIAARTPVTARTQIVLHELAHLMGGHQPVRNKCLKANQELIAERAAAMVARRLGYDTMSAAIFYINIQETNRERYCKEKTNLKEETIMLAMELYEELQQWL